MPLIRQIISSTPPSYKKDLRLVAFASDGVLTPLDARPRHFSHLNAQEFRNMKKGGYALLNLVVVSANGLVLSVEGGAPGLSDAGLLRNLLRVKPREGGLTLRN